MIWHNNIYYVLYSYKIYFEFYCGCVLMNINTLNYSDRTRFLDFLFLFGRKEQTASFIEKNKQLGYMWIQILRFKTFSFSLPAITQVLGNCARLKIHASHHTIPSFYCQLKSTCKFAMTWGILISTIEWTFHDIWCGFFSRLFLFYL